MESKYKVGDKVRIKSLEWYNSNKDESGEVLPHSDIFFVKEMSEYCGKECEVSHVYPNGEYSLKGNEWSWKDWMFEGNVTEKKKEREPGVRYISVQMAIMSHLSDAQDISSAYEYSTLAHDHINFAKQLILTYPDTSIEVSEKELNEIWKQIVE